MGSEPQLVKSLYHLLFTVHQFVSWCLSVVYLHLKLLFYCVKTNMTFYAPSQCCVAGVKHEGGAKGEIKKLEDDISRTVFAIAFFGGLNFSTTLVASLALQLLCLNADVPTSRWMPT